jgi:hypothetical protein
MSDLTIKHRAAAVRNTWSYAERLQRALTAQQRCRRLLEQVGLAGLTRELAYARQPAGLGSQRRSG